MALLSIAFIACDTNKKHKILLLEGNTPYSRSESPDPDWMSLSRMLQSCYECSSCDRIEQAVMGRAGAARNTLLLITIEVRVLRLYIDCPLCALGHLISKVCCMIFLREEAARRGESAWQDRLQKAHVLFVMASLASQI